MQALAFRAADMRFALELANVVQVLPDIQPRPVPLAPASVTGLIRYAGALIPVVDLGLLLGHQAAAMQRATRLIVLKIALPTPLLFAVRAEEVLDLIEIGATERGLGYSSGVAEQGWLGAHILDDAQTAQLINAKELLPVELRALYLEQGDHAD